jgi:chemotaxis regulatin CheY-phosphate phosphatase CheZ
MGDSEKTQPGDADAVALPARARVEIGELTFYLEQALRNLREVNEHVEDSSRTMPGVLHELRDIVKMTEAATVRVLDETEAMVEDGRAVAELLGVARAHAASRAFDEMEEPIARVAGLMERMNDRAMAIMSALEFQDLTAQKVQRAFLVLEEVLSRLNRIQIIIDLGEKGSPDGKPAPAAMAPGPSPAVEGRSAQDVADELVRFAQ